MEDEEFLSVISPELHCYLDRIKDVYNAPFARDLGVQIKSITPDEVSLYLDIVPKHINSRGFVHGAVIYGLTDHTLAFSANMKQEAVGQSSNIVYHRPVTEGRLESVLKKVNESKTLIVYDIRVYSKGKLISSAICTAFKLGE